MKWTEIIIPHSPHSGRVFALFRVIFGIYLVIHFAHLVPFAGELFSNQGVISDATLNFTAGKFPNLLVALDSENGATLFLLVLTFLSILYTAGISRHWVSLAIWYGFACLFHRNNLISNPGLPFIGWLLLASAVIPAGEPWVFRREADPAWKLPRVLFAGAWFIMALSYTISGYHKLSSPSWVDGTAIVHLMNNPLARDTALRTFMLSLPIAVLKGLTWGVLALEVLFLPLSFFKTGRMLAWFGIVGAHLGILSLVSFADLTLGMLMIHVFTFDPRWFPAIRARVNEPSIVFFDGYCGLCDRFVSWILSEDTEGVIQFSPLQGTEAATRLSPELRNDLSTVVYLEGEKRWGQSDAILRVLYRIGGLWRLAILFWIVPRPIRNFIYRWVASHRYDFFGKRETCRMPTAAERARFLA